MPSFPLTDLGMSLSVPHNHDAGLPRALKPYAEAIAEVYTAPPPDVAPSLKPFRGERRRYRLELARLQEFWAAREVALSYTFNTPLSEEGRARVSRFLEEILAAGHRALATFRELEDAAWVHARLPEVEIASSLSSGILGVEQARAWVARAGARVIHPDKLLLRKRGPLAEIRALGVRIKLIINNRCAVGSPYCDAHAGCASMTVGREEADLAITRTCERRMEHLPWTLAPLTLPPAYLDRLAGVLDLVKLDGRNWPTDRILSAVERTVSLRGATFFPWYAEPADAFDVLSACGGDCDAGCHCESKLYLFGPAARRGPRVKRQNRLAPPAQITAPGSGDGLAYLLADAPDLGFRADGLAHEDGGPGLVVDLRRESDRGSAGDPSQGASRARPRAPSDRRWPLRFRPAEGEDSAPAFRKTRRYGISYLFAEGAAPPDLLADLGALGDAIVRRDASLPAPAARVFSPGPVVDRVDVGGFCAEECLFCEAVRPAHRRAPPAPDPALVDLGESSGLVRLLSRPPAAPPGRPRHLELVGENPAGRADLPVLLEAAVRGGYERRSVLGPASSLAVDGWARTLAGAGLTHAAISLYAAEARVHDHLVARPGAFVESLRGLDRLRAAGVEPQLSTVSVASAMRDLPELVARVGAARVFLYGLSAPVRLPEETLFCPSELPARIGGFATPASASAADPGGAGSPAPELHLFALPRCVATRVAAVYPGRVVLRDALPESSNGLFTFAPACRRCRWRPVCVGVPRWALARYGDTWISDHSSYQERT